MMKRKKKALIIGLSVVGGSFISAILAAAFICTAPASVTQDTIEDFDNFAFVNSDDHVSTYKTTFMDKQTSEYEVKYQASIQEAGEKLADYSVKQNNANNVDTYILKKGDDNYATLFFEDFMDNLGKEIEDFFKQIKSDREKVNAQYKINYNTLKKAFNDNVEELHDTILDCERYIAELDIEDEDYTEKVERYQNQIEITRVEIENEEIKYLSDVAILNETYESDLTALDLAEEQVNELKESYEAQLLEEPAPVEEIIEEFVEEQVEEAIVPCAPSIVREAKSVSIEEKEEEEQINCEAMVQSINEVDPNLFSFKCFEHCYLYIEPKDKDSYWHF